MPNLARSPPLNKSLSMSESDIAKILTSGQPHTTDINITLRDNKRRRLSDEDVGRGLITSELESSNLRMIIREELKELFSTLQSQQNQRLDVLEQHIAGIKGQNDSIHKNNLEIEKSLEYVSNKLDVMQSTICRLEEDRNRIATDIAKIEDKCDSIERSMRKTSIQVRNVPKQTTETKETLFKMIYTLSSALKINLEKSELRDVFRVPTKQDQANSMIIIEFSSTLTKTNFLEAKRKFISNSIRYKTEQLNSNHLGLGGGKAEIYISDHLTPQASRLYHLAREFRKTMGYEFCWTSNGLVYLRKKQGDPYILVRGEAQLHLLKNK